MAKTPVTYWNPLAANSRNRWTPIEGLNGMADQLTLTRDDERGDYTRLTRFHPGADTSPLGVQVHDYPEEVLILEGRLYDAAFDRDLTVGDYACRPPGEEHGPFRTSEGAIVLEMSYPSQARNAGSTRSF